MKSRRAEIDSHAILSAMTQVASALHFLEHNKVVHRDVAARNVLVGSSLENVKLSDLGATRLLGAAAGPTNRFCILT